MSKHFDKWLYALRYLANLEGRPDKGNLEIRFLNRLFDWQKFPVLAINSKLFIEMTLKWHRDEQNILQTAEEKGIANCLKKKKRNLTRILLKRNIMN